MSRRVTYYNSSFASALTWSGVFGANYYDHWRAWDAGSLTLTGALVDSAASLTGSGRNLVGVGGGRPTLITDAIIGKDAFEFDGISDFMEVPISTSLYNFLHNGSGGTVIVVMKQLSTPSVLGSVFGNGFGATTVGSRFAVGSTNIGFGITHNGSGSNIYSNATTSVFINNNYQSVVNTFDSNNAIAADRGNAIIDGVDNENNSLTGVASLSNASSNFKVGVRPVLAPSLYYNGTIAEIIILDRLLTAQDKLDVQTILTQDYGSFPIS